jgi:hypothetical protein
LSRTTALGGPNQDDAERVGQADVSELGGCGEREVRVPGLEGALELDVSVALRRHGGQMFAQGQRSR